MPCDSSYMHGDASETEPLRRELDEAVRLLCAVVRRHGLFEVTRGMNTEDERSLEAWWKRHDAADAERRVVEQERTARRAALLASLSPEDVALIREG